jgi:bifunctional DNA-binding transcriptional regulator/antitoxin component of YhaV-PrlF toxin-antitoxin module
MKLKDSIFMTSKGTFTLPVNMRRKLGLNARGDTLIAQYDAATNQVILSKPQDFDLIRERTAKYLTKGRQPLLDVDNFYQSNKKKNG